MIYRIKKRGTKVGYKMLAGLGRFLVSIIFIVLGVTAILNWDMAKADLTTALANWELYAGYIEGVGAVFQYLLAAVPILLGVGIIFQITGGVLVCLSLRVRLGAFILFIQLLPATVLYHHFWFLEGAAMARSLVFFLKNISIIGGLLIIIATGSGVSTSGSSKSKPAN